MWFQENHAAIKRARLTSPWWRENALILEEDQVIKPSLVIRRLADFGYERTQIARGRGLFAVRGGIIEIWPINSKRPWLIEFRGNAIIAVQPREAPLHTINPHTFPQGILEGVGINAKPPHHQGLASVEKLALGSYVVHVDHGIGIFRGLSSEKSGFWVIEYAPPRSGAEPDRLYVPFDQKDRLSPYIGFTTPTIHRLGGSVWFNTRRRIREDAEKFAQQLLALYSSRQMVRRPPYDADQAFIRELTESFQYETTDGQRQAEKEILADLKRERPMDRLLVGDVGFGKTEVAIRASAEAISAGKQVAVLAPTTILASQHQHTFQERLANLPIAVRQLSRLTMPKNERQTLKDTAEGKIDCLIGTHRLLSRDVSFKNLGLVIIDEEQRFGVKQKERFKELRADVDVLSLSATPIPRTLSLALAGLRDISRIDAPPAERMPIVTSVLPYGKKIIRDAIRFELARGGQIYFLHNRIETIDAAKQRLELILRLLPSSRDRKKMAVNKSPHLPAGSNTPREGFEAAIHPCGTTPQISIIHGRMNEKQLIRTMDKFRAGEINILLATTIIENGLDISSANTLIIDDAARLGLAQAHQLRGRIGRGAQQAFAYFLYRPYLLTEKAAARLEALKEYSELGAGYDIALRDLEIRGAGNILGREQAGAINKVGLNLYCQMLAEAIEEKKHLPK